MLLHVDAVKYKCKPTKAEIGGIKKRFTKSASIKDLSVRQIADCLTAGRTIQPGVTPFSAKSSAKGYKGTNVDDFSLQTVFMVDVDNENEGAPKETPEHVAAVLAEHNLKPAFMYETFNSTPEHCRFRVAVICDEAITDRAERDRIQGALIAMFNQSDAGCINADRVFFGTDKGLIDSYTDYDAVCNKVDLLALAEIYRLPEQPTQEAKAARQKISGVIPIGRRNSTLASIALSLLKKYGDDDGAANEAFLQTASKCEQPLDDKELQTIWDSALKAYREKVLPAPDYLSPPEYAAQEFAQSLVPPDYTDVGQARVFVEQYGEKIRYSAATKWLVYDGKKWVESELQAQKLAQELTDRQLIEARKMLKTARAHLDTAIEAGDDEKEKAAKEEEKAAKNFRTFVLARRSSSRIAATLTEARPSVEVNVEDLDRDGFKLNTPAGTVDLRTGKLHPHDPQDLITKMTAVSPSLDGMDDWQDFLNRATSNDRDLEEYLQISSGMEAVGNVYQEKLGLAYGRGGNGKSTYYNSKARVLGDYSGSLSAETLTVSCRKNKNPEYAELRGKRLVIAAELEEGMRLDTAAVKRISSVDYIHAEKKYKDPFQFKPSHTTVLYTNHLPKVGTNDKGTWDRLVVIPFNARFRGMQGEILNYTEYLFEHCGGAILTWIIEGAKKFIAAKYHIEPPECVKRAIEEYYLDNDWLSAFIEECCNVSPEYGQKAGDLYDAYRTHCANKHEWARGTGDFKAALTGAGYNWRKTSAGACYYGLKLKPGFEPIKKVQKADLSFIKNPCAGGDSIDPNFKKVCNDFLYAHGCKYKIMVGYGLTENAGMSTGQFYLGESTNENELLTVGMPALYNTFYVADPETGEFLKTNQPGELIISGKSVMKGYVENPEETNKVVEEKDGVRYLHTGDIGYVDDEGMVYVIDRIKRIIIRPDGHNVFPAYIENVITKHPDVKECVCVGVKKAEFSNGKIPVAFLVLEDGHKGEADGIIEELKEMSLRELPERDVALDYIVIDKMPMTDAGKVDYRALEEMTFDRGDSI